MIKISRKSALYAASILAVAAAMPAYAQDEPSATDAQANEEDGEIVVTAQKRAERVQDVPIAITVATPAQLERQQVNTIVDLARVAPSLEIQQSPGQSVGGGGQIRGIGTQSFNQGAVGSVGVVVDGVSQGNANIADLFDVARVEVLKGPQGTLFGLTTSAGVINISTTEPEFDRVSFRARTELSRAGTLGSGYGRQVVQGLVNLPLADNAAVRVSGNMNLTQGVNRNTYTGKLDPHRTYGGRARLLWEPAPRLTVNLIGDYTKVDDDGIDFFVLYSADPNIAAAAGTCGVTPGPANRDYCSTVPQFTRSTTWGTSLQLDYEADPFTVTSISAYRNVDSFQQLNIFRLDPLLNVLAPPPAPGNPPEPIPRQIIDPKPFQSDLFTQELRFASPSGNFIEYTAGLFFSTMRQHNDPEEVSLILRLPFPGPPPIVVNNAGSNSDISDDSMAIFGQTTIHATPQLRFIAGGRYTVERLGVVLTPVGAAAPTQTPKINVENFSWRLGGQYEFNRDLIAYATYSRGYKGPQIALPAPTAAPGTPATIIRPEIPTSYELGLKGNIVSGLGFEFSGFYTRVKDFQGQQCVAAPTGGINCRPENISGIVSKGVEANLFGKLGDHVSLNLGALWNKASYPAGFTGQDGSVLGGEQLVSAPKWKVTASGEFAQPIGGMEAFLSADAVYKSELRLAASTNPLAIYGDHVTLGGRLGVRAEDGQWTASIFARNLTNNHEPVARFLNFPDGSAGVGQFLMTQSFRQVGLSLDVKF